MSRARDLSKLGNPNIIKADENSVGFGTQVAGNPANASSSLISAGIVTAAQFFGDGSNLEGVASAGLGTAVDDTKDSIGQNIYFTNAELSINANTTVNAPDSSNIAYTQYQQVTVESGSELIIADGDSFIPDVLGIGTALQASTAGAGNGIFGTVFVDNIENAAGRGGPNFPLGITVAGVSTLGGNVSIGGTLTYEDVTNVDSIGVVTARNGIDITGASAGLNASSNLRLKTGGTERVRISSAGLVGIGTDLPGGKVTVAGISASARLELKRTNTNTTGAIGAINWTALDGHSVANMYALGDGDDEGAHLVFKTTSAAASNDPFNAATVERLRIGSAGQLGLSGANYGTSGQVLTSQGASAAPQWADAGGGAWEVVSTTALSGSTSDVQLYGWSNNYAQYKVVFQDCYYASDVKMRIRFYTDTSSGNNGTLVTSQAYAYTGVYNSFGSTSGPTCEGSTQSYFYPYTTAAGGAGEIYTGELIFPMKTSGFNDGPKCYGNMMSHHQNWFGIACELTTNTTHFLTGIHIYFTQSGNNNPLSPTTGRITLLRMKYS
jgi:hypothetical protein